MESHTSARFRAAFRELPEEVQESAKRAYSMWKSNPYHPGLQFKQIHSEQHIFSARVGKGWRAVGLRFETRMLWFWIGSHADYDTLIRKL